MICPKCNKELKGGLTLHLRKHERDEAKEVKTEVLPSESEAKKQFRELIARYKISNPVKYALKEKEFIAQLEQMK